MRQRQRASANSELERQTKHVVDMAASKEEKKFAKDLVGDDFIKFKISLEFEGGWAVLNDACTPHQKRTRVWFELPAEISTGHELLVQKLPENVKIKIF